MKDSSVNTAASILAGGVLIDSAAEHYRAGFHQPAMFLAPVAAAGALAVTANAALRRQPPAAAGKVMLGAAMLVGVAGFAFHWVNIFRRAGGLNSTNIFYGAPAAAPMALTMAGMVSLVSAHGDHRAAPAMLSLLSAAGLAGTSIEAGVLHFRGAFHSRWMYAPVVLPPLAAAALAAATVMPTPAPRRIARTLLRLTVWLGVAGVALHTWGVQRRMGGWRNWQQNLLAGPPLPAPPAFTGLAIAGLAALDLSESTSAR